MTEFARGGPIDAEQGGDDHIPAFLNGGCFPFGVVIYRNDTGRPLRPDEWHLATRVDDDLE